MGQPGAVVEFVGGHADGMRRLVPLIDGQPPLTVRVGLRRSLPDGTVQRAEAVYHRIGQTNRYEFRGRGNGRPG
jgi:hypothetical protein